MGAVSSDVFNKIARMMGAIGLVYLVAVVLKTFTVKLPYAYASVWAEPRGVLEPLQETPVDSWLWVYGLLAVLALEVFMIILTELSYTFAVLRPMRIVHERVLRSVVFSPMTFFDTTPMGRILNRLSKDMNTLDAELPFVVKSTVKLSLEIAVVVIVATVLSRGLMLLMLPVFYVMLASVRRYQRVARDVQRLESITRSPVISTVVESQGGLATIKAFGWGGRFERKLMTALNENHAAFIAVKDMGAWLSMRVGAVLSFVVFAVGMSAVLLRGSVPSADILLALTLALPLPSITGFLVQNITQLELQMTSAERLMTYSELPSEGELITHSDAARGVMRPAKNWPTRGTVTFRNATMRYRADLEPVLKDVSFTIRSGEHVGVVGRTGSGKSSLFRALLRLNECEGASQIILDGLLTSTLGLHDLRKAMFLIPQDATLFRGSLRYNLDPAGAARSDNVIWGAIKRAGLEDTILKVGGQEGLDFEIEDGGSNLSAGQRQLFCIVRALIRRGRILLVDEATASVDAENDVKIQEVLRSEFEDATVLTIAHRLNTIMDSDRIVVMDNGRVAEYDVPHTLLSDPESILSALVDETGAENAKLLRNMAEEAARTPRNLVEHPQDYVNGYIQADRATVTYRVLDGAVAPLEEVLPVAKKNARDWTAAISEEAAEEAREAATSGSRRDSLGRRGSSGRPTKRARAGSKKMLENKDFE